MGLRKYRTDAERKEARRKQAREWARKNRDRIREYQSRPEVKAQKIALERARIARPEIREKNRVARAEKYAENKRIVWRLKAERGCKYCGMDDPICLEFHHRDSESKDRNVGELMSSLSKLLEEAEKCDVVCANCHCYLTRRDPDGKFCCLRPCRRTD